MNAFNKRKQRFRRSKGDSVTPKKAKKFVEVDVPEDLDAVALALAKCSTEKEMQAMIADTA